MNNDYVVWGHFELLSCNVNHGEESTMTTRLDLVIYIVNNLCSNQKRNQLDYKTSIVLKYICKILSPINKIESSP